MSSNDATMDVSMHPHWLIVAALAMASCAGTKPAVVEHDAPSSTPKRSSRWRPAEAEDEPSKASAPSRPSGPRDVAAGDARADVTTVSRSSELARAPEPCPPEAETPAGMACVLGGFYDRGEEGNTESARVARVWVDSFWMDRREVSNAEYRPCIDAGTCERPMPFRGYGRPNQPVVAVSWTSAEAYCQWKGKRLPTEAEWERAARGPENALYPWGDGEPSCSLAHVMTRRGRGCGTDVTRDVGSGEPGFFGLYDMAGNVDEWVADWYAPCYEGCPRQCGDDCLGDNPAGPCQGRSPCPGRLSRVIRGGSWWWPVDHARATRRRPAPPENQPNHRFGFRCARDLPQ